MIAVKEYRTLSPANGFHWRAQAESSRVAAELFRQGQGVSNQVISELRVQAGIATCRNDHELPLADGGPEGHRRRLASRRPAILSSLATGTRIDHAQIPILAGGDEGTADRKSGVEGKVCQYV